MEERIFRERRLARARRREARLAEERRREDVMGAIGIAAMCGVAWAFCLVMSYILQHTPC